MSHEHPGHIDPSDCAKLLNGHVQSPPADYPATPVENPADLDVKIHADDTGMLTQQPIASLEDDASTVAQLGIPSDPDVIPVHSPNGIPADLDDVKMEEQREEQRQSTSNGVCHDADVHMEDAHAPLSVPAEQSSNALSASSPPRPESQVGDVELQPPPAKRPRVHSDVDRASFTQNSATPPPASAAPSPPPPLSATTVTDSIPPSSALPPSSATVSGPSTFSGAQLRYAQSTIRSLKRLKDAAPFVRPVDPVALNVPNYFDVITTPMDFSTIERKLASSNPQKPDPNPENPRYNSAAEFVIDFCLIIENSEKFNGAEHPVTAMGKRVKAIFDKQMKQMPAPAPPPEVKQPPPPKKASPPAPPRTVSAPLKQQKAPPARRLSTTVPVIRRNENEAVGRPKREIHPPPPKDLPYSDAPKKQRKVKRVKDDGTAEQLKFCGKILLDLHRKQYHSSAYPFYEPVDWVRMGLPTYPKVVKRPMDLSTMRKKLDSGEYAAAKDFYNDFKLMIKNCHAFNPQGTPVQIAGAELQRLFEDKWKNLPPLHEISESEDGEDSEDEETRLRQITEIEQQIEALHGQLAALKSKPAKRKKDRREKVPVASTSKALPKHSKPQHTKKKIKKPIADDDVLTFEQKKDLSESISKLDGAKLEKVIQIIHEGVPEIRDSTEEIELEIDTLPAPVLIKLYNFVIRPTRTQSTKRNRTGKGTGTGGLKRKSMDEDVEAEKIRQLEQRMALFDQPLNSTQTPATRNVESDHSSDSSDSESSGSDSE